MNLGPREVVILLIVVLVLFGAKRLPDSARSLGRSMRIFKSEMKEIKSNMTGTVISVLVKTGETVSEGQDVLSIESMKMEMAISSDYAGNVKEIKVQAEDFIQEGQVLIILE